MLGARCAPLSDDVSYNQMVADQLLAEHTDKIFGALADATRRDIVQRVIGVDQSVSSLADRYEMSFAAVQKHVAVLHRAGLVRKVRRGREQIVSADIGAMGHVARLVASYDTLWTARISRMAATIITDETPAGHSSTPPCITRKDLTP